jgi:hypothetical protein
MLKSGMERFEATSITLDDQAKALNLAAKLDQTRYELLTVEEVVQTGAELGISESAVRQALALVAGSKIDLVTAAKQSYREFCAILGTVCWMTIVWVASFSFDSDTAIYLSALAVTTLLMPVLLGSFFRRVRVSLGLTFVVVLNLHVAILVSMGFPSRNEILDWAPIYVLPALLCGVFSLLASRRREIRELERCSRN